MSALSLLRWRLSRCSPLSRPAVGVLTCLHPAAASLSRPVTTSALHESSSRALVVLDELRHLPQSPRPALVLGAAGLLPFVAAPALMLHGGAFSPELLHAQLAYGACILSFLGGVRWGVTLPDGSPQPPSWGNLTRSVAPSLIAWAGLLAPPGAGGLMLIGGLGLAGYWDMVLYGYPAWFKALRFCLSVGAILSLWTALMCKWFLVERESARPEKQAQAAETEKKGQ